MMKHVRYLKSVLRHKWYVFLACLQLRVPLWWAVLHDWDKFLPSMWLPYAQYFYGDKERRGADGTYKNDGLDRAFDRAWNGHQKRNKHHWQYWVLYRDDGSVEALPMPDRHRREMLADWRGAGRAYIPDWHPSDTRLWYKRNCDQMVLHPETRGWIEAQL